MRHVLGNRRMRPGEVAGAWAIALAMVLASIDVRVSAVPLTLFVLASMAAPFLPALGFFMSVVTRGKATTGVALTFDDGPDPITTPVLLELLRGHHAHATFFVTGQRAAAYPALLEAIKNEGHDVGNHSYTHDMFMMLRGAKFIAQEIDQTRSVLQRHGVESPLFRPPVGIIGPDLAEVLHRRGMIAVTYSRRALDAGNRRVKGISKRILAKVCTGDIIMLHDATPPDVTQLPVWIKEVRMLLSEMNRRRLTILPLIEMVGEQFNCDNSSSKADLRPRGHR